MTKSRVTIIYAEGKYLIMDLLIAPNKLYNNPHITSINKNHLTRNTLAALNLGKTNSKNDSVHSIKLNTPDLCCVKFMRIDV